MNYYRLGYSNQQLISVKGPLTKHESEELCVNGINIKGNRITVISIKAGSRVDALIASRSIIIYDKTHST